MDPSLLHLTIMLNEFFASCFFNSSVSPPSYPIPLPETRSRDSFDIATSEVEFCLTLRFILHLVLMASLCGCLGPLPIQYLPQLPLFNPSIKSGKLPAGWKMFNVIPIPKESSKQDVHLFHSISLLPIISKCIERHPSASSGPSFRE